MFDSKKPTQDALEQLEWALERYLEEVVNPANSEAAHDANDPRYKKLIEQCAQFQATLMEAQVDQVLTGSQARLIAINLLLTSFEADSLRRSSAGFVVTSEEWEKQRRESDDSSTDDYASTTGDVS